MEPNDLQKFVMDLHASLSTHGQLKVAVYRARKSARVPYTNEELHEADKLNHCMPNMPATAYSQAFSPYCWFSQMIFLAL